MTIMYDPPSGWRYGFPRPYKPLDGEALEQTLLRDGYPQREIDNGGAKYCRFIGEREELEARCPMLNTEDTAARLAVEGVRRPGIGDDTYLAAWRETQGGERYVEKPADAARLKAAGTRVAEIQMAANDNRPRGPYITTYTDRFYFNDPRPEDFEIEDIAHSLAMTRRYSGHGQREYTTAEHSVHIYRWLVAQNDTPDVRLAGLLHDAPEALSGFGDAASPRKKECPQIAAAEQLIWDQAIAPKYGLPCLLPPVVHEADKRICHDEMTQNLWEVDPNVGPPLGIELEFWCFDKAKAEFLRAFREIQRVRQQQRRVAA